jgi:hypothetical protein
MSSPPREDDAPQSKRRRTALACDSCRARKTRCDGARPACNVCVAMDFDCLYHRPVRHSGTGASRGASHEKDISRLESRLQAMERRLQVLADPRTGQYRHSMGSNESPSGGDATSLASGGLHDMPADTTEDTVDGMGVITFADESEAGYFGPSSPSPSHLSFACRLTCVQVQRRIRHSSATSSRVPCKQSPGWGPEISMRRGHLQAPRSTTSHGQLHHPHFRRTSSDHSLARRLERTLLHCLPMQQSWNW